MSGKRLKLVLDTSTIISALFWDGKESELLNIIEDKDLDIYITKEIIDEIEDVISRPKFKGVMSKAGLTLNMILDKIVSISNLVVSNMKIRVCRDINDNKFLECAQSVDADYIVSGDNDLLSLKRYKGILIVKTSEVLKMI
jgi:putative PIN family toxin of toxin-antitoxin system